MMTEVKTMSNGNNQQAAEAEKGKLGEKLKKLFSSNKSKLKSLGKYALLLGALAFAYIVLFPWGGFGQIGCFLDLGLCVDTWQDKQGNRNMRRTAHAGTAPIRLLEVSKGDLVEVDCSGTTSILTKFQSGTQRVESGCYGLDYTPSDMRAEDTSVWPAPNLPALAAICTIAPYENSFSRKEQWMSQDWAWVKRRDIEHLAGSGDTHESWRMPVSGWLYCWINAPMNANHGRPQGTYWFTAQQ